MQYTVAKSLNVLLSQINAIAPNRSKISDGAIGDQSHQHRRSDHDPNATGVVCARDFTHDPVGGFDSYKYADIIRSNRDPRVKYVISNRRIADPSIEDGLWRPYYGINPHTHHMHISVFDDNNSDQWNLEGRTELFDNNPQPPIHIGTIHNIQDLLLGAGFKLKPNGKMDKPTTDAIIAFQRAQKLVQDGKVGPATWTRLRAIVAQWGSY